MIDRDIYFTNQVVEEFLHVLKTELGKEYSPIKVYISTSNPYNHWLQKSYIIYNNTNLMGCEK